MNDVVSQESTEALVSRNRLIGAIVWLALLVIVVPMWYSHPVGFQPKDMPIIDKPASSVVNHAFILPGVQVSGADNEKGQSVITPTAAPRLDDRDVKVVVEPSKPIIQADKKLDVKANSKLLPSYVWVLRLAAYKNKEMAEGLKDRLKYDYQAYIKHFPQSQYYSVRVGPYMDEVQAKKDQLELNRLLRVKSELVKISPSSL